MIAGVVQVLPVILMVVLMVASAPLMVLQGARAVAGGISRARALYAFEHLRNFAAAPTTRVSLTLSSVLDRSVLPPFLSSRPSELQLLVILQP